ncbi:MAG: GMP/IMP nucleotidase [Desulfocapsaceae bacterium]
MYTREKTPPLQWQQITTVLLDMDGTLLDKYYDDYFWEQFLPLIYGKQKGLNEKEAQEELFQRYRSVENTLMWSDLNYWSEELGLDIIGLKKQVDHLVCVNPHVIDFLQFLQNQCKKVYLVTAAHRAALDVKMNKVDLRSYFQGLICAHELGKPKEDVQFWSILEERLGFERDRTLFVDDNVNVLSAAHSHGIRYLIHIAKPSSRQPTGYCDEFTSVRAFDELLTPFADPFGARRN